MQHRPDLLLPSILLFALAACSADAGGVGGPTGGSDPGPTLADGGADDPGGGGDPGDACLPGTTRACYPGPAGTEGVGACAAGTQGCEGSGEFGTWGPCVGATVPAAESCGDGVDQDCDGADAPCDGSDAGTPPGTPDAGTPLADGGPADGPVAVDLFLVGDCVTASCPAEAPYPVGCEVLFTPGDDRGCVASRPDSSVVYFQAGDECDAGLVSGTLYCASTPGAPLDQTNCPINKPTPMHVTERSECPATH